MLGKMCLFAFLLQILISFLHCKHLLTAKNKKINKAFLNFFLDCRYFNGMKKTHFTVTNVTQRTAYLNKLHCLDEPGSC